MLPLLYTPSVLVETALGNELRELAPAFLSRVVGDRYRGYLSAQKERLVGSRGQRNVNRPELVEAHGFDTKYAMHVLRLAVQGRELLETGRLELPIGEPDRARIRAVREGAVPYDEVVAWIEAAERDLARAHEGTRLPEGRFVVRCTTDGVVLSSTTVDASPSGVVEVRIENKTDGPVSIGLGDVSEGGRVVAPGASLADTWDVSSGPTTVTCIDAVGRRGEPTAVEFVAEPDESDFAADNESCEGFATAQPSPEDDVAGIPFGAVTERVRSMIGGLLPTDEIRVPVTQDGPTATWRVSRNGEEVAFVEYFRLGGERGWVVATGNACRGLSFRL